MPNNLAVFSPTNLSALVQDPLHKSLVGRGLCSERLAKDLSFGASVDITRVNPLTANAYVDADGVTPQDITPTKDTLTVNGWSEVTFDVSKKDKIQNKISAATLYTKEAAYALRDDMDTTIFNATDGLASATTNAIAVAGGLTTANVISTLGSMGTKLREQNVDEMDWACAISPADFQIVVETLTNAGFNTADRAITNGYVGDAMNFKFYVTNNLPANTMLGLSTGAMDLVVQSDVGIQETTRTVGAGAAGTAGNSQIGARYITDVLFGYELTTQGEKMVVAVDLT